MTTGGVQTATEERKIQHKYSTGGIFFFLLPSSLRQLVFFVKIKSS